MGPASVATAELYAKMRDTIRFLVKSQCCRDAACIARIVHSSPDNWFLANPEATWLFRLIMRWRFVNLTRIASGTLRGCDEFVSLRSRLVPRKLVGDRSWSTGTKSHF